MLTVKKAVILHMFMKRRIPTPCQELTLLFVTSVTIFFVDQDIHICVGFQDMMQICMVHGYWCFVGLCCLFLQGRMWREHGPL